MTHFYIIPGFGEKTSDAGYTDIIKIAVNKKYKVIEVNPQWEKSTITGWLEDFNNILEKNQGARSIVLGFSFGAYIAALAAKTHSFEKIIFCSLSPYFKDDFSKLPEEAFKVLGVEKMKDFSLQMFPTNVSTSAVFVVGDKDIPLVIDRVKKSYTVWSGPKEIKILSDIPHDINYPVYIKTIEEYM